MKVPVTLAVAGLAVVAMLSMAAAWSLTPTRLERAPAPSPSPTEQTVFVPLADCDRYGCAPAIVFAPPTP